MHFSRRLVKAFLVIMMLLASVASLVPEAEAWICGSYNNSSAWWFPDHGFVCAYTGSGCSECTQFGSSGYTVCVEDATGTFCIDYQY